MGSTTVRVAESLLAAEERLGAGTRGIVSSAPDVHLPWASSLVYKKFRPAALDELDVATLEAMAGYLETLAAAPRGEVLSAAAWPCRLVEDGTRVTGFVMPAIPRAFYLDMSRGAGRQPVLGRFEHLLTGESFLARHRIPLANRHRYQLLAAVAHALTVFHGHGIAVGNLSPKHLLFALDPEPAVYFIGCEAMRFKGRSALPQSETIQWEVRTANPSEELATPASDSHKLGLLALRLLAGNPSLRDPDRLTPEVPQDVRSLISEGLRRNPAERPAPSEWDGALVAAVETASTRLPGEPKSRADASASTPLSSLNAPPLRELAPPTPSRPRPARVRSRPAWWWQRRSRLEQAGAVAGVIIVLGMVGLVAGSLVGDEERQGPITTDVGPGGETASVGHSWSRVPHDEAAFGGLGRVRMRSVVAGGPGLVAVGTDDDPFGSAGSAAVWTSEDGRTWSRVAHDDTVFGADSELWMHAVASGESGLVAVGMDTARQVPAVWTSPDGQAWSRVPLDDTVAGVGGGQVMHSVVARQTGFVAVGEDAGRGAAAVWTSEDGQTWVRVPHDETVFGGAGEQVMRSVAAGGPGLVAVGYDDNADEGVAAVWTSEDGQTWSRVPHDEAVFGGVDEQWMTSVAAGGPGVVAVGTDAARGVAAVWTSPDGQAWSRVPHDPTVFGGGGGHIMVSVVAGGPGLVAVGADFAGTGESTAAVWTSEDGQTWSRVRHDPAVFGGLTMWSIVELGPQLVAVGTDGARGGGDTAAVWVGE